MGKTIIIKNVLTNVYVGVIMLILIASCSNDFETPTLGDGTKSRNSILDAKEYFEKNAEDLAFPILNSDIAKTRSLLDASPIVPHWNESKVVQGEEFDVVQIPLESGIKLTALKEFVVDDNINKEITPWFSNLLVTRNTKTNNRDMLVFSIIPDGSWLKTNPNGVNTISFDQYVQGNVGNYSGVILVSFLDGRVSAGTRYVEGKITHRLSTNPSSQNKVEPKTSALQNSFKLHIHRNISTNESPKTRSYTPDNSECLSMSGGSGWCESCYIWHEANGTTDNGENMAYAQNEKNIPKTFPTQSSPNSCATSSMSYVNHIFGGNVLESDYNNAIKNSANGGVDVTADGLSGSQVGLVLDCLFVQEDLDTYDKSLAAGHVIMTNMGAHSVTIVGRNGNDYIYMDPEVGHLQQAGGSKFGSIYSYAISGIK